MTQSCVYDLNRRASHLAYNVPGADPGVIHRLAYAALVQEQAIWEAKCAEAAERRALLALKHELVMLKQQLREIKAGFDPGQPRDEDGKWTDGDGGDAGLPDVLGFLGEGGGLLGGGFGSPDGSFGASSEGGAFGEAPDGTAIEEIGDAPRELLNDMALHRMRGGNVCAALFDLRDRGVWGNVELRQAEKRFGCRGSSLSR